MSLRRRLLSRRAAHLLTQNTIASTLAFVVGLGLMWLFVGALRINEVVSAALSFLAATSLHYLIARAWVFRGTRRKMVLGYGYFLVNAAVGLLITVVLFAALMRWTAMNYLIARTIVSLFAGLAIFLLNALLNFKKL